MEKATFGRRKRQVGLPSEKRRSTHARFTHQLAGGPPPNHGHERVPHHRVGQETSPIGGRVEPEQGEEHLDRHHRQELAPVAVKHGEHKEPPRLSENVPSKLLPRHIAIVIQVEVVSIELPERRKVVLHRPQQDDRHKKPKQQQQQDSVDQRRPVCLMFVGVHSKDVVPPCCPLVVNMDPSHAVGHPRGLFHKLNFCLFCRGGEEVVVSGQSTGGEVYAAFCFGWRGVLTCGSVPVWKGLSEAFESKRELASDEGRTWDLDVTPHLFAIFTPSAFFRGVVRRRSHIH